MQRFLKLDIEGVEKHWYLLLSTRNLTETCAPGVFGGYPDATQR